MSAPVRIPLYSITDWPNRDRFRCHFAAVYMGAQIAEDTKVRGRSALLSPEWHPVADITDISDCSESKCLRGSVGNIQGQISSPFNVRNF